MHSESEEKVPQETVASNFDGDFWGRLNAAYTASPGAGDFQADYYWPTKDNKLAGTDLVVEIVGGKAYTEGDQPRLHFYLRLPALNKTGIKSCRLAPESMRFLRMDMERLGVQVDDVRRLGAAIKGLYDRPIKARLYVNDKTGWQDLDFMGFAVPSSQPEMGTVHDERVIDPATVKWDFDS
jgi:hypothetical protein